MLFNHKLTEKLKSDHRVDPSRAQSPGWCENPKLISGVSKLLKTFDKLHGFISKTALRTKMEWMGGINIEYG